MNKFDEQKIRLIQLIVEKGRMKDAKEAAYRLLATAKGNDVRTKALRDKLTEMGILK